MAVEMKRKSNANLLPSKLAKLRENSNRVLEIVHKMYNKIFYCAQSEKDAAIKMCLSYRVRVKVYMMYARY